MKPSQLLIGISVAIAGLVGYNLIYVPQQAKISLTQAQRVEEQANQQMQAEVALLLQQAEPLHILRLAGLAHAGFQETARRREDRRQIPVPQGCRLVQGAEFALEERHVMQGIEDQVLALASVRRQRL